MSRAHAPMSRAHAAHEMAPHEQILMTLLMQSTLLVVSPLIAARAGFVTAAHYPRPLVCPLRWGCAQKRRRNKSGTRRGSRRMRSDGAHASDRHAHEQIMRISL